MNKNSKYRPVMDEIQSQIMRAEIGVTGLYQIMLETLSDVEKDLAPQWVSVSDRLPEEGVEVLCWFNHEDFSGGGNHWHKYMELCTYKDGVWFDDFDDDCNWVPTHWQSLPAVPEVVR